MHNNSRRLALSEWLMLDTKRDLILFQKKGGEEDQE